MTRPPCRVGANSCSRTNLLALLRGSPTTRQQGLICRALSVQTLAGVCYRLLWPQNIRGLATRQATSDLVRIENKLRGQWTRLCSVGGTVLRDLNTLGITLS